MGSLIDFLQVRLDIIFPSTGPIISTKAVQLSSLRDPKPKLGMVNLMEPNGPLRTLRLGDEGHPNLIIL